jgi:Undecaprenyl-phosphate galactose phosphotransferase WbaP
MLFTTWNFIVEYGNRSRGILFFVFIFALILPPIAQFLFRRALIRHNLWGAPVVVLGAGQTGEHVIQTLLKDRELGFNPIALFDDNKIKWGTRFADIPIIGSLERAHEFSEKTNCALIALPGTDRDRIVGLTRSLPFFYLIIIPDLVGLQSLWVEPRDLGGVIGLEIQKNLLLLRHRFFKSLLDYMLGLPLFIISIPIVTFFSIWIILVSPGNPFYCQVREGYEGKKFRVWKLRTMFLDSDSLLQKHFRNNPDAKHEWHQYFKLKDDPRVLPVLGNLLRRTSLDELPQLWNVLSGEMSLVGPRPFPHYHLEQFDESFRKLRRSVIPGMTGMWQVNARSDGNLDVQEALDSYYIRNWSIWLDLSLLAKTFWVVLSGKGAY